MQGIAAINEIPCDPIRIDAAILCIDLPMGGETIPLAETVQNHMSFQNNFFKATSLETCCSVLLSFAQYAAVQDQSGSLGSIT